MKYLVIGKNPTSGALELNVLDSREKAESYIKFNYSTVIENLIKTRNYDFSIYGQVFVIEIEPNYEVLSVDIVRPVAYSVKLRG